MALVFDPPIPPQIGASGTVEFNVKELRFGEGYVGSFGEGINNKRNVWPLTFHGTEEEIMPIKEFFDDHKGYISFYWTPPLGVQGLYRVKSYMPTADGAGNYRLTATLEEYFAP